jgi:glutamate/tyrosine decarboxylase-like PLP-dependent enzyme
VDNLKSFYELDDSKLFLHYLEIATSARDDLITKPDQPRLGIVSQGTNTIDDMINKFSVLPENFQDPNQELRQVVHHLFSGVPRWKSPRLQINTGTAPNSAATAAYALALQENIINVNSLLTGNTLVAEHAVTNIMASLAELPSKPHGIFTYGGSGTNLYALKLGLRKAVPSASREGLREKVRVFVTEDSHFSQVTAVEWLGVGVDNVVTIKASADRTTDLRDLEKQLYTAVEAGYKIGAIYANGGTTFDHTIDDIPAIVDLRNQLVKKYDLPYIPHVHVDSVIGWIRLAFQGYDWTSNSLNINKATLPLLQAQYNRIKHVNLADSWGVDFHKATGSSPVVCSMVMINKFEDAMLLSRKASSGISTHQLAEEYHSTSPMMQYTLENSRSVGAPLAALVALRTLGKEGYRLHLANLIEQTQLVKELLHAQPHVQVTNRTSPGFTTLVRLMPPGVSDSELEDELVASFSAKSELISRYTKEFFMWDSQSRMQEGKGVEYSFTERYFKTLQGIDLYALKLYPVSPYYDAEYAKEAAVTIIEQEKIFRENIWKKK